MKVRSVNIGFASRLSLDGDYVQTGIFKSPVKKSAFLTQSGFRGDIQVDRKNHGGPDKAVCVYCADHFEIWTQETGSALSDGAFGENLSVEGMPEWDVLIGDVYRVGRVRVQVSQPRQPCHKLSKKMGDPDFANRVIALGLTGFYFRVIDKGVVRSGDAIELESRDDHGPSIAYSNGVLYDRLDAEAGLDRVLASDALSDSWRKTLTARKRSN